MGVIGNIVYCFICNLKFNFFKFCLLYKNGFVCIIIYFNKNMYYLFFCLDIWSILDWLLKNIYEKNNYIVYNS